MADHQNVVIGRERCDQSLEAGDGTRRRNRVRDLNLAVVSHFCAHQRGGLQCALERAGDDQVELNPQGVQVPGNQQALLLAFFVERTLDVNGGVCAADTGARMSKNVKVHRVGISFSRSPSAANKALRAAVARAIFQFMQIVTIPRG